MSTTHILAVAWLSASLILCNISSSLHLASADDAAERHMNFRIHGKGKASNAYTHHPTAPPRTRRPTTIKTQQPSTVPTLVASGRPTLYPTKRKTHPPSISSSSHPSSEPHAMPSANPSPLPTPIPTQTEEPSITFTMNPTEDVTSLKEIENGVIEPTSPPSTSSTSLENLVAGLKPTNEISSVPSPIPSIRPSHNDSTETPTTVHSTDPSQAPTLAPSDLPTVNGTSSSSSFSSQPSKSTTNTAPSLPPHYPPCEHNTNGGFGEMSNDNIPLQFWYEVQYNASLVTLDKILPYVEGAIVNTVASSIFIHGCNLHERDGRDLGRRRGRGRVGSHSLHDEQHSKRHRTRMVQQSKNDTIVVGIGSQPNDRIVNANVAQCHKINTQLDDNNDNERTNTECRLVDGRMILYYDATSLDENDTDGIRQIIHRITDVIRTAMNHGSMNDAHDAIVQVTFIEENDVDIAAFPVRDINEEENGSTQDEGDGDYLPTYAIFLIGVAGGGVLIAGCLGWMCNRRNAGLEHEQLYGSSSRYDQEKNDVMSISDPSGEEEEDDAPFESSQRFDFGLLSAQTIKTRNPWEGPSSIDEITLSEDSRDNSPSYDECKTVVFG